MGAWVIHLQEYAQVSEEKPTNNQSTVCHPAKTHTSTPAGNTMVGGRT
jgi:hypothetical protein